MRKLRYHAWWISVSFIFSGIFIGLPAKNAAQLFIGFALMLLSGIFACLIADS